MTGIQIGGKSIKVFSERDPAALPWKELGVDIVIESTGFFTNGKDAGKHIQAGARKVIISAPGKDVDLTVCMGVNDNLYDAASTTSSPTPPAPPTAWLRSPRCIMENFGIVKGLMTTVHAYTNDQSILDLPHSDLRRARAAALSMIPTTTGAAKAVALVLPELKGKLDGLAVRVPTPNVSLVDLVVETEKAHHRRRSQRRLESGCQRPAERHPRLLRVPLVSCDFNGNPASSTVDAATTTVIGGNMVKVMSWYDNEWGYSNRIVDLVKLMAKSLNRYIKGRFLTCPVFLTQCHENLTKTQRVERAS